MTKWKNWETTKKIEDLGYEVRCIDPFSRFEIWKNSILIATADGGHGLFKIIPWLENLPKNNGMKDNGIDED